MQHTQMILKQFESLEEPDLYFNEIIRIISIARLSIAAIEIIDSRLLDHYKFGHMEEAYDVYQLFLMICMALDNKPQQYWDWLLK